MSQSYLSIYLECDNLCEYIYVYIYTIVIKKDIYIYYRYQKGCP